MTMKIQEAFRQELLSHGISAITEERASYMAACLVGRLQRDTAVGDLMREVAFHPELIREALR